MRRPQDWAPARERIMSKHETRIMYIEDKSGPNGLEGDGRIGLVTFSKTGRTLHYNGRQFQSLKGLGFKANYIDVDNGDHFWISGCRKDGNNTLYGGIIEIDEDVRERYWTEIRNKPERAKEDKTNG
jgi:hypothetical protein